MIFEKFLGPLNLSRAQNFYIYKTIKIIIIDKYQKFVLAIFLKVLPYFKNINNSQKFTILSFKTSFFTNYFTQKVGYWVLLIQIIQNQLPQNYTNSVAKEDDFNMDIVFQNKIVKNWCLNKQIAQMIKVFLTLEIK